MLELLLPQRCLVCRHAGVQLCTPCLAALPRLRGPCCERCGAQTAWPVERCRECAGRRLAFARARSAVAYDDAVRALVAAWKERGLRRLTRSAAELVVEVVPPPAAQAVTFVPGDGTRTLQRGHHPPERLARELARRWRLPVEPLLRRTRPLARQRGLAREERRRNVAGAFAASRTVPVQVVLVDDVYTSGATVSAAAAALRAGGAERVEVVTLARVIRVA